MFEKFKKNLNIENDNNYILFEKNYKQNLLSDNAFYNILEKEYGYTKKIIEQPKKVKGQFLISVIIPTYNRKEQLKECIDSILMQTYENFEVLIIDDCSTDNTQKFLNINYSDKRIKYFVNKKNSGAGVSRKNGYLKAKGDYIIFCDDDDYFIDANYFAKTIDVFKDKSISVICVNSYIKYEKQNRYIFNQLNVKGVIETEKYLENFQFNYMKPNSTFTAIFRKESLEKAKFEEMQMVNDSSIYLRSLISRGKVYFYNNIIGIYRVHSKNITFNIKSDFLINNLIEKKKIYDIITSKKIIDDPKEWLYQQVKLTYIYYLDGTNPSKNDVDKVIEWIRNNTNLSINEFMLLRNKYKLKKTLKKLIRR